MNPLVSIVIPSYNRGYCLEACLRSALQQSYKNIEIIVVDDASRDDTKSRVMAMADPRLHYVAHKHNRGGGAARNTGIHHASGEYIAFLDSDDRWAPDKLEKQMTGLLAQGDGVGFSYTWLLCVDADDQELMRVSQEFDGDCRRQILVSNFVGTFSNVLIRRDLLVQVGWLDEEMKSCQDWDMFIRLLAVTQVHCLREYVVYYRQSNNDEVRISLNPHSVVQGHRRILNKFSSEYRSLSRKLRREALLVYFNAFVGVGAFSEAAKVSGSLIYERAGPLALLSLARGLVRAGNTAIRRKWTTWNWLNTHGRGVVR